MSKRLSWKAKFSILMVILIIIIYGSNYLVLGDAEHIISYIWTHLGFIPVDILIVAFLLDEIIERKERPGVSFQQKRRGIFCRIHSRKQMP